MPSGPSAILPRTHTRTRLRRIVGAALALLLVASLPTAVGITTGIGTGPARADSLVGTLNVGTNPIDIVIDATGTYAYAAGCDPDTGIVAQLIRINLATFTVDDTLPMPADGRCVRSIALVDDSILFTTDARLYRISATTFGTNIDDSVAIPELGDDIAVHGSYAYIVHLAGMSGSTVSKVNISGSTMVRETHFSSGGDWPLGMAIDDSGTHGYVVNAHSDSLAKIRLSDGVTVATIPTGNQSYGIEIDPTGRYAYIPAAMPDAGQSYPWLVRVDLNTFTWDDTVNLPFQWGFDIALTPDGAFGYVGESRSGNPGRIAKIDLGPSMSLAETILSNPGSHVLAVDPAGAFVYSADYNDHNQMTISKIAITSAASPPTVTSLSVAAGPLAGGGTTVVSGTNLTGATSVSFGATAATILSGTDDTIAVSVPAALAAGAANVTVTTGAGTSTQTVPYTYVSAPVVTGMDPASGPTAGGTTVTITGTDLSGASVDLDGVAVTTTSNTATQIAFTTPASPAGPVTVTVTTPGGSVAAGAFAFIDPAVPPVIVPSPPGTPTATPGPGSASVSWSAPTDEGSFPVTHYEVRSAPAGGSCLTPEVSCEITGLRSGVAYTFTVRALSGAGWSWVSGRSKAIEVTGPSITITGERRGKRLVISGVMSGVEQTARLTPWAYRAGHSPIRGRGIEVASDGSFTWSRRASKKATWHIHVSSSAGVRSNTLVFDGRTRR